MTDDYTDGIDWTEATGCGVVVGLALVAFIAAVCGCGWLMAVL